MKNILIMGIGRTGKTTLSNMIKAKYSSYNLIHSDSIKWAMIRAEDKEAYYRENVVEQKAFEQSTYFQKVVLEFFNSSIRNSEFGYILESGQLTPKLVKKYIDFKNTIVICLGLGNLSKEDIFNMCRKHDTKNDWSYDVSDENLKIHIDKWYERNEQLKIDCSKYNIKYVDTSIDRENILKGLLEEISKKI